MLTKKRVVNSSSLKGKPNEKLQDSVSRIEGSTLLTAISLKTSLWRYHGGVDGSERLSAETGARKGMCRDNSLRLRKDKEQSYAT
jgi:hypothetical protein